MSLRWNIFANYVGQIYITLIGIIMVPIYLRYLGAEAYGLVGFYTMLQTWFMMLDAGLTPTMARETACYRGGATDPLVLRRFLRFLEIVFSLTGLVGGLGIVWGAAYIASHWLKIRQLNVQEVQNSIMLMAGIAVLRWVCELYRGVINGFERMVWLNSTGVIFATARSVLVVPFFWVVGARPFSYFVFQFFIVMIETVVITRYAYRWIPEVAIGSMFDWDWKPLLSILKFSLGIALMGVVYVLITQLDKLVLSKILPLHEYGYYTLGVIVAGGISLLGGPIGGAVMPRLTRLSAAGQDAKLFSLYCDATQMVALITTPAALVMICFAESLLWAWTGNREIAAHSAVVLRLYAIGNAVWVLSAFPYYLQFAKGDLKFHIMGNIINVSILVPMLIWATYNYGVIGAGVVWFGLNTAYFLAWVPLIHRHFQPGLHLRWLVMDLGPMFILMGLGALGVWRWVSSGQTRIQVLLVGGGVYILLVSLGALGSKFARGVIREYWRGGGRS